MSTYQSFKRKTLFLFCCIWNVPAVAATFVVGDLGDASDWTLTDSLCKTATNTCTLRAAIEQANALSGADTITFNTVGTIAIGTSDKPYYVYDSIVIDGGNTGTTIDGQNFSRIFSVEPSPSNPGITFELRNLTLTNGYVTGSGGAIAALNNTKLTIIQCTFSNNTASSEGGAIYTNLTTTGDTVVTESIFSGNLGKKGGGGIKNHRGGIIVSHSTFSENQTEAGFSGGAILNGELGTLKVTNSTFYKNGSSYGGGIANDGSLELNNVTFSDNVAASGGGLYNSGTISIFSNTLIANSDSFDKDCYNVGTINNLNHVIIKDGSCGGISADPLLQPLQNNGGQTHTMALQKGSPAIDAGDSTTCEALDQRGLSRFDGDGDGVAVCDIGAFESQDSAPLPRYGSIPKPGAIIDLGRSIVGVPKTSTLTIQELGEATLIVDFGELTGPDALDFKKTETSNPAHFMIENGGKDYDLIIECTPSKVGTLSAVLKLTSNDLTLSPVTYFLTCIGESPGYSSKPFLPGETIKFEGPLGNPIEQTITIAETGDGDLVVDSWMLGGTHQSDFTIIEPLPAVSSLTIKDNSSETKMIRVQCTPSDIGLRQGLLTLRTNDPKLSNPLSYPLECKGIGTAGTVAQYVSSPPPATLIDFGSHLLGESTEQILKIENKGDLPLEIRSVNIDPPSSHFKIIQSPLLPIASGGQETLILECNPSTEGLHSATLILTTNDPNHLENRYSLLCRGIQKDEPAVSGPLYASDPPSGHVLSFQPNRTGTLTIYNQGQTALTVGFGGIDNSSFQVISPLFPITIEPQTFDHVTLQCVLPEGTPLSLGNLQLESPEPHHYPLICSEEVQDPGYSSLPLPEEFIFIESAIGQPVTTTLTIIEVGNETVQIPDWAIEGVDRDSFSLQDVSSPLILPNGGPPIPVMIQCIPRGIGEHRAQLMFVTNDPRRPVVSYQLSCLGLFDSSSSGLFPTDIRLSNNQVSQYVPIGTFIGRLTTIDSDSEDFHRYTLLDDAEGRLVIYGDGLYTATAFSSVTPRTLTILVRSTNSQDYFLTKELTINISEVQPELDLQIYTQAGAIGHHLTIDNPERFRLQGYVNPLPEHLEQPAQIIMMVYWTPPNRSSPISIPVIRKGILKPHLEIDFFSGRLLGAEGLFEVDFGYQLANGYAFSVPRLASLTVWSDRPPTDIFLSANTVSENSPPGTVIGTLSTLDPDTDEAFTYAVVTDPGKHFIVIGNELQVSSSFPLRFDERREHDITIRSIDVAGNYVDKSFTITVH